MEKKDLKPAGVFHYFEEICQVPRPSKKEEKIIAYLKAFGENEGGRSRKRSDKETRYSGYGKPQDCRTSIAHRHGM